ncbi:MAG: hypothetical protein CM15mP59_5370 [Flavobacteriaceae bacterium]|nr:MAG: hypothetical protein CM15mP59_5370 [Flavobacteriaceae bacterium]
MTPSPGTKITPDHNHVCKTPFFNRLGGHQQVGISSLGIPSTVPRLFGLL